ncbi:MAG: NfeD family protein [Alphaproteobacteria bacterium]|jgi:membrane protein implicated in regulation of membrane protease activity
MTLAPSILWLLAGAALLALEAFGIPGIGFLFIGLGAIVTGIAVEAGITNSGDYISQFAIFFVTSGALTVLLWRKLKTWHTSPKMAERYSNMVGDQASVGKGGLTPGKEGRVGWSGTTMRAVLAPEITVTLAEGATVTIVAVKGNLVSVKPN